MTRLSLTSPPPCLLGFFADPTNRHNSLAFHICSGSCGTHRLWVWATAEAWGLAVDRATAVEQVRGRTEEPC